MARALGLDDMLPTLRWYDIIMLDWDTYSHDRDEMLQARSALEFERGHDAGLERLADTIDAYWRAHPREFNYCFRYEHAGFDPATELESFVADDHGRAPPVPADHWWWRPLPVPADPES